MLCVDKENAEGDGDLSTQNLKYSKDDASSESNQAKGPGRHIDHGQVSFANSKKKAKLVSQPSGTKAQETFFLAGH